MKKAAITGTVILALLIVAILVSAWGLFRIRDEVSQQKEAATILGRQAEESEARLAVLQDQIATIEKTSNLAGRSALMVLAREGVLKTGPESNIDALLQQIEAMPDSERKTALVAALVVAVKDFRFRLGGQSLAYGLDSPGFANFVLATVGKGLPKQDNVFLSETMMQQFQQVGEPQPGDLMFFDGHPGNFVLFYMGPGPGGSPGTGVGHLKRDMRAGIYETSEFSDRFLGYYRY